VVLVWYVAVLLFSLFFYVFLSLLCVCCVCLLCVFVYAYVCFSVLWAQLPELNDMRMMIIMMMIINLVFRIILYFFHCVFSLMVNKKIIIYFIQ